MGKMTKVSATIALDSEKQKSFTKSVKKLQKKVKTSPAKSPRKHKHADHLERGLVYLSHIPKGFFEPQISQYFKQFGVVTNVRVLRSHNTGRSKGAAFIEFQDPEVAKIAAETMDNYLMFKRRLEAKFIQPEEKHKSIFKIHITEKKFPKKKRQDESRAIKNASIPDKEHKKRVARKLKKMKKSGVLDFCQVSNMGFTVKDIEVNTLTAKVPKIKEVVEVEKPTKKKTLKKVKTMQPISPETENTAPKIVKKSSIKTKTKKEVKKIVKEPVETFSDDSIVISDEILKPKKKSKLGKVKAVVAEDPKPKKSTKEGTKSLKTIKKTKDKKTTSMLTLKPEVISKISTRSTNATGKSGKAKLTLDPSLVTEVKFSKQKGKKTVGGSPKKITKKAKK